MTTENTRLNDWKTSQCCLVFTHTTSQLKSNDNTYKASQVWLSRQTLSWIISNYRSRVCSSRLAICRLIQWLFMAEAVCILHTATENLIICSTAIACMGQIKLEKVALDGSVECCAPPPRWRDLDRWLLTSKPNQLSSVPRRTSDKSLAKIR